jgi:hypothetical protein
MRQIAAKIERSMRFNTDKKEQMEVEFNRRILCQ